MISELTETATFMESVLGYVQPYMTVWHLMMVFAVISGCMLVQAIISAFVMKARKDVLREEYNFSNDQIKVFFWKSVLLFPITWWLLTSHGLGKMRRKIFK